LRKVANKICIGNEDIFLAKSAFQKIVPFTKGLQGIRHKSI